MTGPSGWQLQSRVPLTPFMFDFFAKVAHRTQRTLSIYQFIVEGTTKASEIHHRSEDAAWDISPGGPITQSFDCL